MPLPEIMDCHLHVIDPERFAFQDGPGYRPLPQERGPRELLAATLDAHHVRCGLLVQPSCYGRDNSAMLDAMAGSDGRLKGIAVVGLEAAEDELQSLREQGVVGIRWNLEFDPGVLAEPRLPHLLAKVRALGWWVEVNAVGELLVEALAKLRAAGVRALVDHWGRPLATGGPEQPAFQQLLRFGREGTAVVKLSAPYRVSLQPPPYSDLDRFAEALLAAFTPQRCVWGSDWPFINTAQRPDYQTVKAAVGRWVGGNDLREVLWATPRRLFGMES